jgi:hypothetical protein
LRLGLAARANSSRLIFNALPLAFISVICVMTHGHCSLTWRGAQQVNVDNPHTRSCVAPGTFTRLSAPHTHAPKRVQIPDM